MGKGVVSRMFILILMQTLVAKIFFGLCKALKNIELAIAPKQLAI